AGLVVLGAEYAWIGVSETAAGTRMLCGRSAGRHEHTLAQEALPSGTRTLTVRARCDAEGTIGFAWRPGETASWRELDTRFAASAGRWIGAEVGLFAAAPLGTPGNHGHATFGAVSVELVGAEEEAA
ncbi:MAG: glycoside hydrolase 43 family protein, partial [Stackebrandtia sp.]